MKYVNILALVLIIVGGLNWGLVGLFDFNLMAAIFGAGSFLGNVVYILVGIAAAWSFVLLKPLSSDHAYHGSTVR